MYPIPKKAPFSDHSETFRERGGGIHRSFSTSADRYVLLFVFSLLPSANFQWKHQFPRVETIAQRLLPRPWLRHGESRTRWVELVAMKGHESMSTREREQDKKIIHQEQSDKQEGEDERDGRSSELIGIVCAENV